MSQSSSRSRLALLAASAAGAALLTIGVATPAGAADFPGPGLRFYTGADRTGTELLADENDVGVCHELTTPALSYTAITSHNTEVFFNPGCEKGTPEFPGDWYFLTGTFNGGDFPFPALSYRVLPN
ncbi:hypothetical protein [Streptomyces sp. B93]|uniref:hypothetical protein n=1 Tax=Streptomyces sp. B93 TaxID=2824875 RepID=UPI001B3918B2|nr:hypothetical protein [Streptomyces sp. B93]MBQ1089270.1 hypothetical protein [Streptomyces sp. B93]